MNSSKFWFDTKNQSHIGFFLVSLIALNFAGWMFFKPKAEEVVSLRKPVIIIKVVPDKNVIKIGEPYRHTVHFEKTRDDCSNGRLVRHMWSVGTGKFYKVEQIATVQATASPKPEPIYLETSTSPMNESDRHLAVPGFWKIRSTVSYDCPTPGSDDLKQRDVTYDTPVFEIVGD